MSYLLDALKQSQHADMSAEQYDLQSEQLKQQEALGRYRRLAFVFGGSLAVFITVAGGFVVGKWLQTESHKNGGEIVKMQQNSVEMQSALPKKTQGQTINDMAAQTVTQQAPQQQTPQQAASSPATLQGQLVFVQTPSGVQQMLLTPQGQYIAMAPNQGRAAQAYGQGYYQQDPNQQHFNQQNKAQEIQKAPAVEYQAQNTASAQLDMSKYKVLGRQLNNNQNTANDPTFDTVPNTLKSAFAQAVQETQQANDYEVTQGTKSSSRVEPVELLPDGLQAILPPIKYQAHIYSSSADKRWIKLNGRELYEGESLGALTVREITPEQSVLDFDGYEFSLKALQDWPQ
jgi:general secretion pathway protein B